MDVNNLNGRVILQGFKESQPILEALVEHDDALSEEDSDPEVCGYRNLLASRFKGDVAITASQAEIAYSLIDRRAEEDAARLVQGGLFRFMRTTHSYSGPQTQVLLAKLEDTISRAKALES